MVRRRPYPGTPAAFTARNSVILTLLGKHATRHRYVFVEKERPTPDTVHVPARDREPDYHGRYWGGELLSLLWSYASTFHLASVCRLRPLAVVSDIWQLPAQFQ